MIASLALVAMTATPVQAAEVQHRSTQASSASAESALGSDRLMLIPADHGKASESDRSGAAAPMKLALTMGQDSNQAHALMKTQTWQPAREPEGWLLAMVGVLLIVAMARRRVNSMES